MECVISGLWVFAALRGVAAAASVSLEADADAGYLAEVRTRRRSRAGMPAVGRGTTLSGMSEPAPAAQ